MVHTNRWQRPLYASDDVVFDHIGDAFVVGVATVSGNRITAEVNHDGDPFLRERLTAYITNAVLEP